MTGRQGAKTQVEAVVLGTARRLFYCPDIDAWDHWKHERDWLAAQGIGVGAFGARWRSD